MGSRPDWAKPRLAAPWRHAHRRSRITLMAVFVWIMVGIALWHFAILVPDRFWGGIVGAFLAASVGGLVSGYALPTPGVSSANPPGVTEAVYAVPGALVALAICWWYGDRVE